MKSRSKNIIVLVTAPDLRAARKVARAALKTRAAACANLVSGVESHYWWRGKLESDREVLIVFKTPARLSKELEQIVIANHPYDTPEFVALPIDSGNKRYLAWLESVTQAQ